MEIALPLQLFGRAQTRCMYDMQLATGEVGSNITRLLDSGGATICLEAEGHGNGEPVVHSEPLGQQNADVSR
jgi:hypothetical protein